MASDDQSIYSREQLQRNFEYKNGLLYRRHGNLKGRPCLSKANNGYLVVNYKGQPRLVHRLIFVYHHGFLPIQIDHINGIRDDNRIENLRSCNQSQNNMNAKKRRTNGKNVTLTSSFKGVSWRKDRGKWRAYIFHSGRQFSLGHYDTEIEAAARYNEEAIKIFGEFSRLNSID